VEFKLLEELKEGWSFRAQNIKTGIWRGLTRFHYFQNGTSLCGKYRIESDACFLPDNALSISDCCQGCLKERNL
jgi:hypothetical protein